MSLAARFSEDEIKAKENDPDFVRTYEAWNATTHDLFRAERALVETEPTTVAGAAALLAYAAEIEQTGQEWINDGIPELSPEDARTSRKDDPTTH